MSYQSATILAQFLGLLAAIAFVSIAFDVVDSQTAIFAGVVLSMLAGFMWAARGRFRE